MSILFLRSSAPLTADVDDEVVMLDPATSNYFGLDGVGARIWDLCEQPQSVEALVAVLITEYDVDDSTCSTEVMSFLAELEAANLLISIPSPGM
jgi:hypothetical protein